MPPGDAVGGNGLRLVVTTDEVGPMAAGTPVRGATVLVDHGAGALERLTTDATGAVTLDPAGLVAFHVIYGAGAAWRLYTVATGADGPVTLGGNSIARSGQPMTVVLPGGPGNDFTVHLPEHCVQPFEVDTPRISFAYDTSCEAQTVHAIGFNSTDLTSASFVDAGMIKLVQGSQVAATGSYAPLPSYNTKLINLPMTASSFTSEVLARSQLDLTPLELTTASITISGPAVTLTSDGAPGGNTLRVRTNTVPTGAFASWSEQIAPATFAGAARSTTLDASTLLPAFRSLNFTTALGLSWTGGGATGSIVVVDVNAGPLRWNAYLPPTATSVAFPALPDDLGVPPAPQVQSIEVARFDVPGATAAGLAPTIDQRWRRWPHDAGLLPPAGARKAWILYALGTFTGSSAR